MSEEKKYIEATARPRKSALGVVWSLVVAVATVAGAVGVGALLYRYGLDSSALDLAKDNPSAQAKIGPLVAIETCTFGGILYGLLLGGFARKTVRDIRALRRR